MKKIWGCRRTWLATLAIVGLLYIMDRKEKDFAVEIVALAGGVAAVNMLENRNKKKVADVDQA